MSDLQLYKEHCPYCGECIELLVDPSVEEQNYIEDCSVCCRPITVQLFCDDDAVFIQLFSEND